MIEGGVTVAMGVYGGFDGPGFRSTGGDTPTEIGRAGQERDLASSSRPKRHYTRMARPPPPHPP